MIQNAIAHPKVVARDEWLTARKTLLEHEKCCKTNLKMLCITRYFFCLKS